MKNNLNNLALEFISATEQAAIAAAKWIGRGEKEKADKAAVDAMRARLNQIDFCGQVVIGEGKKDESFELPIGEILGACKSPLVDIAVDPLECTSSVAYGRPNALTVIATGPRGTLYHAVDSYMEKICVGPAASKVIELDAPTKDNIKKTALALQKDVSELTVAVLDRPRHENFIKEIRKAGARVQLFSDGDVAMAIATCMRDSPIDLMLGVGGSTEAVLAAAAVKCLGGQMFCRWKPVDFATGKPKEDHVKRLHKAGISNFKKIFSVDELAKGKDITFTATGVITGPLLRGVVIGADEITTHSLIIFSLPKMVRFVEARHAHKHNK
jgi:fructose-1,6-bisphosphatase II